MDAFDRVLTEIVTSPIKGKRRMVAIDGMGASGKTTFSEAIVTELIEFGSVVLIHADDFFNETAVRHARGRYSAEGFWLDTYNLGELQRSALEPLRSGKERYQPASFDRANGIPIHPMPPPVAADADATVVVEGAFLNRDELAHFWDYSVFLDVTIDEATRRMQERSGASGPLEGRLIERYFGAQFLYFEVARPWSRATVTLDNSLPAGPRIVAPESTAAMREATPETRRLSVGSSE